MKKVRLFKWLLAAGIVAVVLAAMSPWIVSRYWRARSSNPVRRGVMRASELGCFSCHGESGRGGIPIPGRDQGVPGWDGGVWMMYVEKEEDIRRYIMEGSSSETADHSHGEAEHGHAAVTMPAYKDVVGAGDIDDLVATFKVLSGMSVPASGTPERAGYDLAREWQCFACHGPAGAGGKANPGSFTGFIPGWYGADFNDLVHSRQEFDLWVRDGTIPRLSNHPIAKYFLERQTITMPSYSSFGPTELDALWAYSRWLKDTDGGHRDTNTPW